MGKHYNARTINGDLYEAERADCVDLFWLFVPKKRLLRPGALSDRAKKREQKKREEE